MREIKFRAKTVITDSWVYGHYAFVGGFHVIYEGTSNPVIIKLNTLGEYTGLKDKNGREIYEGDITIDGYGTVTVIENDGFQWLERIVRLRDRHISKEILIMTKANAFRCEVIGNIYENPELLEGE